MSLVLDVLAGISLVSGAIFCLIGGLGLLRMPDFYTRMHGASITESLGVGLILLGLVLHAGLSLVSAKLIILGLLIFFTSPTATHALAKAAWRRGVAPQLGKPGEERQNKTEGESSKP